MKIIDQYESEDKKIMVILDENDDEQAVTQFAFEMMNCEIEEVSDYIDVSIYGHKRENLYVFRQASELFNDDENVEKANFT